MRRILFLITLISLAGSSAAIAQCALGTTPGWVQCPTGCGTGSVPTQVPYGGNGGDNYYTCTGVYCPKCGYQLGVYCTQTGYCVHGELHDPGVRDRLIELAKSSRVLVSDCKGSRKPRS